jgi:hypothetical protein
MTTQTTTTDFSALGGIITGKTQLPPRILLYGIEKIGKSTLAASAPKPIFVPTEDGLGQIDCARFPLATNYEQVTTNLEALLTNEHDYGTVVVDSGDWLERLIYDRTCKASNVTSIELAAGGYGKGYTAALAYWREILDMLDACRERGMIVIIICHAIVEKFDDPDSVSYDRYSPKLHKKTSGPLLTEWADAVLFATRKIRVAVQKEGMKSRATATGIGKAGGERVLRCVGGPSCVAGNRYSMPDEIPLTWDDLQTALSN